MSGWEFPAMFAILCVCLHNKVLRLGARSCVFSCMILALDWAHTSYPKFLHGISVRLLAQIAKSCNTFGVPPSPDALDCSLFIPSVFPLVRGLLALYGVAGHWIIQAL